MLGIVAAVLAALVIGWVLMAGRLLVRDETPIRADAVVVLSGDALGDRLRAGAMVLQQTGSGRLVVFVQGASSVYDVRRATLRYLAQVGVPRDLVRLLPPGSSTAEEAGVFAAYAESCGWGSVDVVTSPFHTGRAGWLFRRALGDQADVVTVAADQPYDAARWWRSPGDRESTMLEWVKAVSSTGYVFWPPSGDAPDAPC